MIFGAYGIGYWIAACDPFRHWSIVLVGFLGKMFGPIGFLNAVLTGSLPCTWGATIITNDLIWWVPFASILYRAFRNDNEGVLAVLQTKTNERTMNAAEAIIDSQKFQLACLASLLGSCRPKNVHASFAGR